MILAVDIGGTKIAAAAIAEDGAVRGAIRTVPTPASQGPRAVLAAAAAVLTEARTEVLTAARAAGESDVRAIGVSSAGVVDTTTGTIVAATDSLPGWGGTPVAAWLADLFGVPVRVLGDGNAFGVGEAAYGAGAGLASLLLIAVGTGIGGASITDGEPLVGAHFVGGHLGHVAVPEAAGFPCPCGREGHAEAVGGGAGLVATYHRLGGDPALTTAADVMAELAPEPTEEAARPGGGEVPPAARGEERPAERGEERPAERGEERPAECGEERPAERGEERPAERGEERPAERGEERPAERAVALAGAAVGRLAGSLANVLDPAVVVLAGGMARPGGAWERSLRTTYEVTLMPALAGLPLVLSSGGVATALRGAAAYTSRRLS